MSMPIEDPRVAVERLRAQIETLRERHEIVEASPVPIDEVERRIDAWIKQEAAQRSSAGGYFLHAENGANGLVELLTQSPRSMISLLASIAPDGLRRVLLAEAKAALKGRPAPLSAEERASQIQAIDAEILAAERGEEAAIEAAEGLGIEIARRPDADPRAILGLGG